MRRAAAVILNYNDAKASIEAVKRLRDMSHISHVIVVDNASTDGSAELIGRYLDGLNEADRQQEKADSAKAKAGRSLKGASASPKLGSKDRPEEFELRYMLVLSDRNGGYGYGNNIGVRYAYEVLGEGLCLIANPDSIFDDELLGSMLKALEDEDTVLCGAVMSSKEKADYEDMISSAWPLRTAFSELLNSGPVLRRLFKKQLNYDRDWFSEGEEAEVGCVHGSLLLLDCKSFLALGGFDERVFLYCEENILAHKIRDRGYRIRLCLKGSYSHKGASSIKHAGLSACRRQAIRQSSERYYYRHYLKAGLLFMAFSYVFQMIVMLETFVYEKFLSK